MPYTKIHLSSPSPPHVWAYLFPHVCKCKQCISFSLCIFQYQDVWNYEEEILSSTPEIWWKEAGLPLKPKKIQFFRIKDSFDALVYWK